MLPFPHLLMPSINKFTIIFMKNQHKSIFYSIEIIPAKLQFLFQFNPLYQYLTATGQVVLYEQVPSLLTLGILAGLGLLSVLIGTFVFKKNQDKFIYYV